MKVLVTGAKGMLGQDLCLILKEAGYEVFQMGHSELDIVNEEAVNKALDDIQPEIILHCAAYTNVDKAESDYGGPYEVNVIGTSNLARAAAERDITIVYISTDYVFDGEKKAPYTPEDAPNPINIYGETKYLGEIEIQKYCKKFYIARTSWLYGIHGKNFVETMINLAKNNSELKVVDDQIGSPTWTVELARGVLKILKMPYGIYHLSCANQTTWFGFAKKIFEYAGMDVNLIPCTTKDHPRPAKRPPYSYMDSNSLLRPWEEALRDYMEVRNRIF